MIQWEIREMETSIEGLDRHYKIVDKLGEGEYQEALLWQRDFSCVY